MKENLVIGGDSFIGQALAIHLACGSTSRRPGTHQEKKCDVIFDNPTWWARKVFMCAAVKGYGTCERDPDAYRVNVDAPTRIARAMPPESKFIFLSSKSVRTALHTNYAMMKALAEQGLLAIGNTVVIRLPRVTQDNLSNVVSEIIRLSEESVGLYEITS